MKYSIGLVCGLLWATAACGQEQTAEKPGDFAATLDRAIHGATEQQRYELAYRFRERDEFRWQVEHVETLKTSINEHTEVVSSRTQSHSHWTTVSVDSHGQATLVQTIPWIKWWQRKDEQEPIEFDTRSDVEPPQQYAAELKKVGIAFPSISVHTNGKLTKNREHAEGYDFGAGSFWIPLPSRPVSIGQTWAVPNELLARNDDNSYKRIKTQVEYKLAEVNDGVATIQFETQVLTPINSPKVHSQICQQLTRGQVEFDLARGLIVSKRVNWNEKVIGFHGDNSLTHYLGEYTIRGLTSEPAATVATQAMPVVAKPLQIRTRDDPPVFRR